MSGTLDESSAVQIRDFSESSENAKQEAQPGVEQENGTKKLTPSQKMDELIRASSPKHMKREVEKLRKEAAKYRTSSQEESLQRAKLQQKASEIQEELEALKTAHRELKIMRELDKAGCLKSELVAKAVPCDCNDFAKFIAEYKEENSFLFQSQKISHGGAHKPSNTVNLTPSQQIDSAIRKALGR